MGQSLDDVRKQLRDRLEELGPLVAEYEQLERASRALGEGRQRSSGRASAGRRRKSSTARAPRGQTKQAIYAVIGERSGVSVGEIASVTGITKPLIYNATRTGVQKGELRKVDVGGGRSGFALAGNGA